MAVFEDILEKAKEITYTAGKKTGEIYEVSKLKWQVMQVNNEVKAIYEKLGSSVYGMVKADYENPDLVASIVKEIDILLEKLNIINEKIAKLQKINLCNQCGSKNPVDYAYCFKCGTKLQNDFPGDGEQEFAYETSADEETSE
ncbi:MAG: zinc ribbon domain-containing protein [Oscillospiraceae bacterium]|nr:zinc ribbon domain-containing protein [Oscillospiraceae bacterium]